LNKYYSFIIGGVKGDNKELLSEENMQQTKNELAENFKNKELKKVTDSLLKLRINALKVDAGHR